MLSLMFYVLKKIWLPLVSLMVVFLISDLFLNSSRNDGMFDMEFIERSDQFYMGTSVSCRQAIHKDINFMLLEPEVRKKLRNRCINRAMSPGKSIFENLTEHIYAFLMCFSFMGVLLGVRLKYLCNSEYISDVVVSYLVRFLWLCVIIAALWSFTQRYIIMPELDELLSLLGMYLSGTIVGFARA